MCTKNDKNKKISKNIYEPRDGTFWSSKNFFLEKLQILESFLIKNNKYEKNTIHMTCDLCKSIDILNYTFYYKNIIWNSDLMHYVDKHNIKPPSTFILFVLEHDPDNKSKCKNSKLNKFMYVKIKTNQLLILDALMEHGGIMQRYKERHDIGFKYSEHSGILVFDNGKMDRVIISGSTERVSTSDPDIFFPILGDLAYAYEYIFHTHPATPTPGGRAIGGVLYELPSSNDIYHFVEHFNSGKLQGSLVLAPEGLYNMRKNIFSKKQIHNIGNDFGLKFKKVSRLLQHESIKKYGTKFSTNYFYEIIAHDTTVIDGCNNFLEKYDIHIDFYPRQITKTGNWIIGTVYLPMCAFNVKA
jgi:hypothetical protein